MNEKIKKMRNGTPEIIVPVAYSDSLSTWRRWVMIGTRRNELFSLTLHNNLIIQIFSAAIIFVF